MDIADSGVAVRDPCWPHCRDDSQRRLVLFTTGQHRPVSASVELFGAASRTACRLLELAEVTLNVPSVCLSATARPSAGQLRV